MTKSESKYFNTARIMDEALISLLGKKSIEYISVKEICGIAGVNRSTFYLHYETISDLLDETIDYIQSEFMLSFTINAEDFINHIDEVPLQELILINQSFLTPYLRFIREHKQIYKASFVNHKALKTDHKIAAMYKTVLKPIFCRFGIPENDQKYWLVYHIDGINAIVKEWLKGNCSESIEELTRIIEECVRPGTGRYGEKKQ